MPWLYRVNKLTLLCGIWIIYNSFIALMYTVSPNDFGSLSTILTFDACVTRRCVNVTIVDDELLESLESFSVTLQRTSTLDSRITLAPTSGRIYIY